MSAGHVSRLLSLPLLGLVWMYRVVVSPLLGANCRYQPTCSEYARIALQRHGAFRGSVLIARRMGRCHPWGGSGYDPVPDDIRRDQESS